LALGGCCHGLFGSANQACLAELPSLAPKPAFHVAGGANEIVLQSDFDQATITVTDLIGIVLCPELVSQRFYGFDRTAIVFFYHISALCSYRCDGVGTDGDF
jgi:hypothetical protein